MLGCHWNFVVVVICVSGPLLSGVLATKTSFACPQSLGNFLKSDQCNQYYTCRNGHSIVRGCPRGKLFDVVLGRCLDAGRVDCDDRPLNFNSDDKMTMKKNDGIITTSPLLERFEPPPSIDHCLDVANPLTTTVYTSTTTVTTRITETVTRTSTEIVDATKTVYV